MTTNAAMPKQGNENVRTPRKWVAPKATRFSAGLAENGFSSNVLDGIISYS